MSTLRDVITRTAELVAESAEGRAAPVAYFVSTLAQTRYNTMIRALFGHGIGIPLTARRPTASETVVQGRRYNVGATALTLTLPEEACDGHWFGVTDTNAGLAAANVTLARNGMLLEGAAANITLATSGTAREWFFRADTGNWERVRDLELTDTVYFPDDIVHGLPAMLALELLPIGYPGHELLASMNNAARARIDQRYGPKLQLTMEAGLQARTYFDITTG